MESEVCKQAKSLIDNRLANNDAKMIALRFTAPSIARASAGKTAVAT